jgi:hypothetical protein
MSAVDDQALASTAVGVDAAPIRARDGTWKSGPPADDRTVALVQHMTL